MVRPAARTAALLGALSLLTATSTRAQDGRGHWRIELHTGVGVRANAGTSISTGGVVTKTGTAGFLGTIGVARFFGENLAGTLSAGVLSVGTEVRVGTGGVVTRTAMVMPFFVGVRRYLASSDPESRTRFFGSLEVGPVTGQESGTSVGSTVVVESITRTALGGRTGVGVEFLLGSRASLGIVGGYTFMTDFSDPIGGEKNHSGADFGLSFGISFGG